MLTWSQKRPNNQDALTVWGTVVQLFIRWIWAMISRFFVEWPLHRISFFLFLFNKWILKDSFVFLVWQTLKFKTTESSSFFLSFWKSMDWLFMIMLLILTSQTEELPLKSTTEDESTWWTKSRYHAGNQFLK